MKAGKTSIQQDKNTEGDDKDNDKADKKHRDEEDEGKPTIRKGIYD